MEIDPLIDELKSDWSAGTRDVIELGAKTLVACAGAWPADSQEEFQEGLVSVGRKMVDARPSFAPLFHLVTELYALACEPADLVMIRRSIRSSAVDFTQTLTTRAIRVAQQAVALLEGAGRVLTIGRSLELETALVGAVREKCLAGLVVGEGRPDQAGRDLAAAVAGAGGINVRVVTDSALPQYLDEVDLVMVGTDAVRSEGVVARTGTLAVTAAATASNTPVYLLAGGMKLLPGGAAFPDPRVMAEPGPVWDSPPEGVAVENPVFEIAPLKLFQGVVMETGTLPAYELEERVRNMPVPPWYS
jgi:translation initiation factor 2B subunit (eIF-2B alpha/beta/delta family)